MKQIPEGMLDEELPLLMLALSVQCTRKHQVHSVPADVLTWSAVTDWADVWWSTMPLSGGESSLRSNIPYPDSIPKLPRSLMQLQVGGTFQSTQALPTCQGIVNHQHLSPILGFPILGLLHNRKSLNVKWSLGSAT